MKIETLERYIKKTSIPYGDLLKRASKTLEVKEIPDSNGTIVVKDKRGKEMILYFEDALVYEENRTNGLIATHYNYG